MKKVILSVLTLALSLSISASAFASSSNVNTLVTKPPISIGTPTSGDVEPYGSNPPGSYDPTHDLTISPYNYQVIKVGAEIYTDKWLTGKTSMKITINNWTKLNAGGPANSRLTINVYDDGWFGGTKVASHVIESPNTNQSVTFTGLDKNKEYYIEFDVPENGNSFSFDGSIS